MIKILIMDDSVPKIGEISNYLVETCLIPLNDIDSATNINEGRKLLYKNDYDLLLLDLVMPLMADCEPDMNESPKFIDEIYTNSYIHIPVHIIGFSQYDEILKSSLEKFEDKLWHLIKFNFSKNDWKVKLQNKIQHLIKTKESFKQSLIEERRFDYGIICALEMEQSQLHNAFINVEWKKFSISNKPFIFYSGEINTINGNRLKIVTCCINQMGMQAAAVISTSMYSLFNLDCLFMTGICAGIRGKVDFGDIVVAKRIYDYGSGKLTSDENNMPKLAPDFSQMDSDIELLNMVSNYIEEGECQTKIASALAKSNLNITNKLPSIVIGPSACGSYVIANTEFMKSLNVNERKLLGVDMEGYGLYLAAHISQRKCLYVKSISDFGEEDKDDKYQKQCAYSSAHFVYLFLRDIF